MRKAKVWDARQLPAYLTVAQYGELMGICPKTVRRMCQRGELPAHKEGRMMSVYTCYNAAGDVIGEGTARELWEAGVFSNDNAAYYTYKEQGGRCIKRGIAKMTCRKEMRKVGQNNARGEKADCAAKKPERPVLRKIKDPTPLDYDVHDLILYNAIAKKEGRPELTYGYWAAAGKPARP